MRLIAMLILLSNLSFGQFEKGTITAGTLFGFTSMGDSDSDSGRRTTISTGKGINYFSMNFEPTIGYFITDKFTVDALTDFTKLKYDESSTTFTMFGVGSTYYLNTVYLGGGYSILKNSNKDTYDGDSWESSSTSSFLRMHVGYVHKLVDNVYLDTNAYYLTGIGKVKYEDDGDSYESDNTGNAFGIQVGIKAFFKLK